MDLLAHVNEEFMEYVPGLLLFRVVKGPREGPISWYPRDGQFPYTPKFSYLSTCTSLVWIFSGHGNMVEGWN